MNEPINIRIRDYSETPGPRYVWQGPYSGEDFYKTYLKPAFEQARGSNTQLIIDLDGVFGYPDSFIEEAFGSLSEEFGYAEVDQRLQFLSTESRYVVEDIKRYIRERHD